jgi:hypothetical protein
MRSFEGQHSDNVAIKRSREEKQRQLAQLKEQLATLKAHAAPAIREALVRRIAELDTELRQPPKPARPAREDGPRGPRREGRASVFRSDDTGPGAAAGNGGASGVFTSPRRRS